MTRITTLLLLALCYIDISAQNVWQINTSKDIFGDTISDSSFISNKCDGVYNLGANDDKLTVVIGVGANRKVVLYFLLNKKTEAWKSSITPVLLSLGNILYIKKTNGEECQFSIIPRDNGIIQIVNGFAFIALLKEGKILKCFYGDAQNSPYYRFSIDCNKFENSYRLINKGVN